MPQKSIVVPKAPPYWNCGVLGSRAKGKPKPDCYQSGFGLPVYTLQERSS